MRALPRSQDRDFLLMNGNIAVDSEDSEDETKSMLLAA